MVIYAEPLSRDGKPTKVWKGNFPIKFTCNFHGKFTCKWTFTYKQAKVALDSLSGNSLRKLHLEAFVETCLNVKLKCIISLYHHS